jgi:hypothetical protein
MGLCHYFLKQPEEAVKNFTAALKHTPDYIMARGWISQIASEAENKGA